MSGKGAAHAVLALLLILPWTGVYAATPDNITIDGDLSEWDSGTLMDTSSHSVPSFRMTWNETHLFFAWHGTDWANTSEGADFFVYLNTTGGGSPLSKDWHNTHTLPFYADFAFVLEDYTYFTLQTYDGVDWTNADQTGVSTYIGNSDNNNTEIAIPWTNIGSPTSIGIIAWSQWQDDGNVWISFPEENPASNNGAETFTHVYMIEDRTVEWTPANLPRVDLSGSLDKVDDALNLAIIFHQHQPYYKNKLTGMVEMPWVRVHAMTEYVDSPGILSGTDTKVTYNLVPSFIEQLLDYSENGVLDVHTDIARRSWNADGYPNATALELHTMQFQSFWNSGWIYNVTAEDTRVGWLYPSSQRYSELYGMTMHNLKPATIMADTLIAPQDFLDLQVLWYLYQFSPSYVQGTYNASHLDQGLINLFMQNGQYSLSDLTYVLDAQESHMSNILPMYSELASSDQVELTTTPYYHPIMPLLMMDGWTFEDGIHINKKSWPEDVTNHLQTGMDLFEEELGFRPVGMWPSEQAVSPDMVQPVADVGIEWMVTDEVNLEESTDLSGETIKTSVASNLATPWLVDDVAVVFRDRVISDRIAFEYGSMTPEDAVSDFLAYCDNIRQQLLDEGKDPSEHLLTVALDGENWMFMSEFQNHDNGRPFTEEWFSRLSSHPTVVTTTPGEFLEKNLTLPEIDVIGTGSWIDGTLSTWAGEAEESLAWQRTTDARQALVVFEENNPDHTGLNDAWESLYIAEGSDWFWWYGLDQDSGYDELWDTLFKVHLSNIYKAINLELPPYLQDLWSNPALPLEPYSGIVEPLIDGLVLPGEWDGSAKYDAPTDGGELDFSSFHLGYDASNVYVRVDMSNISNVIDSGNSPEPDISVYFMQPNAINFNEVETNFRTYYGNEILGFPAKSMINLNLQDLRSDGRASWILFTAQGKIGAKESWVGGTPSALGTAAVDDVIEFQIPWAELGLAPRYSTRVKVVASLPNSTSYGDGIDLEMAPPAPAEVQLPDLESWVEMLDMDDEIGDEDGSGGLVYATSGDFSPGSGLFDLTNVKMKQSSWNVRFEFTVAEMTNIWGMTNGFSHQIVQVYVDRDRVSGSGNTELLEGANAEAHPDWAWEVALSATGEPGAVKAVLASTGETTAKGLEVSADILTKTITMTVSKDLIGDDPQNYGYIIILGSQDGFGPGKWREVDATAGTWVMGGGSNAADDGIDYDPNILDMLLDPEVSQSNMLSAYSTSEYTFAQLTGIEIPEVPQQIFGLNVGEVTGTTAVLTWSTTRSTNSSIEYHIVGQQGPCCLAETPNSTSHGITLIELVLNTTYVVTISVDSNISVTVNLTTTNEIDTTPPEILNFEAEVLDGGQVRVTWFTSEATTEHLTWEGGEKVGDTVAQSKSHEFILSLPAGELTLTVTASDSAGNTNTSSTVLLVGTGGNMQNGTSDTPCVGNDDCTEENDTPSSIGEVLKSPTTQLLLLVVAIVVGLAFFRAGRGPPDFGDEENVDENYQ